MNQELLRQLIKAPEHARLADIRVMAAMALAEQARREALHRVISIIAPLLPTTPGRGGAISEAHAAASKGLSDGGLIDDPENTTGD